MPSFHTSHFGQLEYSSADTIDFGEGLPGFESERRFVVFNSPFIIRSYSCRVCSLRRFAFPRCRFV